jgi:hypothetical protein
VTRSWYTREQAGIAKEKSGQLLGRPFEELRVQSAAKGADVVALVNISTEKWPRRGVAPLWISERKPLTLRRISYIMLTRNLRHFSAFRDSYSRKRETAREYLRSTLGAMRRSLIALSESNGPSVERGSVAEPS